jgi:hypothetical protein
MQLHDCNVNGICNCLTAYEGQLSDLHAFVDPLTFAAVWQNGSDVGCGKGKKTCGGLAHRCEGSRGPRGQGDGTRPSLLLIAQ